uniref:Uncharacterized protein n=1 Tax=Tetranychus urticae TaxID=32264 RepID=T1JQ96_TETUR
MMVKCDKMTRNKRPNQDYTNTKGGNKPTGS